jgi:hypothetical protein
VYGLDYTPRGLVWKESARHFLPDSTSSVIRFVEYEGENKSLPFVANEGLGALGNFKNVYIQDPFAQQALQYVSPLGGSVTSWVTISLANIA